MTATVTATVAAIVTVVVVVVTKAEVERPRPWRRRNDKGVVTGDDRAGQYGQFSGNYSALLKSTKEAGEGDREAREPVLKMTVTANNNNNNNKNNNNNNNIISSSDNNDNNIRSSNSMKECLLLRTHALKVGDGPLRCPDVWPLSGCGA